VVVNKMITISLLTVIFPIWHSQTVFTCSLDDTVFEMIHDYRSGDFVKQLKTSLERASKRQIVKFTRRIVNEVYGDGNKRLFIYLLRENYCAIDARMTRHRKVRCLVECLEHVDMNGIFKSSLCEALHIVLDVLNDIVPNDYHGDVQNLDELQLVEQFLTEIERDFD